MKKILLAASCGLLSILLISFYIPRQTTPVTRAMLIEKLAGKSERAWYKCGSLTKEDRLEGDKRYVFSKQQMTFRIETCGHLRNWKTDTAFKWNLRPANDDTPSGFHHFVLVINKDFASFRFDPRFTKLRLKLKGWESELCLQ